MIKRSRSRGIILYALATLGTLSITDAKAQAWPSKAEMNSFEDQFSGSTVLWARSWVTGAFYLHPSGRYTMAERFSSKPLKGWWKISYSSINRTKTLCLRDTGPFTCYPEALVRQLPRRPGDVLGLSRIKRVPFGLPVSFGFAEAEKVFKKRLSK